MLAGVGRLLSLEAREGEEEEEEEEEEIPDEEDGSDEGAYSLVWRTIS